MSDKKLGFEAVIERASMFFLHLFCWVSPDSGQPVPTHWVKIDLFEVIWNAGHGEIIAACSKNTDVIYKTGMISGALGTIRSWNSQDCKSKFYFDSANACGIMYFQSRWLLLDFTRKFSILGRSCPVTFLKSDPLWGTTNNFQAINSLNCLFLYKLVWSLNNSLQRGGLYPPLASNFTLSFIDN